MIKLNTQIIKKQKSAVKHFDFTVPFLQVLRSKYLFHADL